MRESSSRWLIGGWLSCCYLLVLLLFSLLSSSLPHQPRGFDITTFSPNFLSRPSSAYWQLLSPTPSTPSPSHPAPRYGHSSISTPSSLVITHGYFFNHTSHAAVWLSDTWAFSYSSVSWQLISSPCTPSQAAASLCPGSRFGATTVTDGASLYLYGGDDGRHTEGGSYEYHLLSDLWLLPLNGSAWQLLPTHISSSSLTSAGFPSSLSSLPLAQHTAYLLSSQLFVFGGMIPRRSDDSEDSAGSPLLTASNLLWSLDLPSLTWRFLPCTSPPPPRFGHSMAGYGEQIYLYGGFKRNHPNYSDLWRLTFLSQQCQWQLLSDGEGPNGRGYATLIASSVVLLLFAGSHCNPGCVCSHEAWAWDVEEEVWSAPVVRGEVPQGRYKHTAVRKMGGEGDEGRDVVEMIVFGGESYQPQKYHADVWLMTYDHWHDRQWRRWLEWRPRKQRLFKIT